MKKIALFVSVLLLAGSLFAAGPVFEAKPAISGDASFTFGINLDASATGIKNSSSTNLTLALVNKDSDEKGAKEGEEVYGWIKLKDFEMKIDGTLKISTPGIEAKLFLGPVYINILGDGASTAKTLVYGILGKDNGDGVYDILSVGETTTAANVEYKNKNAKENKGIVIGLTDTSVVDVQIGVNSLYTYETVTKAATYKFDSASATNVVDAAAVADPANVNNVYNFWGAVALKAVAGLTFEVKAGLTTDFVAANPFGLGAKAGYDIDIAEGIKVTPMVGFDIQFLATPEWRLSAGLNVGLPGSKLDDWEKLGGKWDIKPGLSVLFAMDDDNNADLSAALFDGDLLPVVNVVAVGEVFGLTSGTVKMGFGAFLTADLDVVSPYAGFQTKVTGSTLSGTILQAGVDIKVITNTTFTLAYKSGDLSLGTPGKGNITFTTKIAY
jgi:hypothetical protein